MSIKGLLKVASKFEKKISLAENKDRTVELYKYFTRHASDIFRALPSNLTDGEKLFYSNLSQAACKNPNNPGKMMDVYKGRIQNVTSQVYDKFDVREMRGGNLNEMLKKIQTRSYEIYKIVWSAYHSALELNDDPLAYSREFDADGSAKNLIRGTIPGRKDLGAPEQWRGTPYKLPS